MTRFYTMYQNGPGAPLIGAKASQAIDNGMTPGGVSLLCEAITRSDGPFGDYGIIPALSGPELGVHCVAM